MRNGRTVSTIVVIAMLLAALVTPAFSQTPADASRKDVASSGEVSTLKQQVADQQKEIQDLQNAIREMKQMLAQGAGKAQPAAQQAPSVGQVASATPVIPASAKSRETLEVLPPRHPVPQLRRSPHRRQRKLRPPSILRGSTSRRSGLWRLKQYGEIRLSAPTSTRLSIRSPCPARPKA